MGFIEYLYVFLSIKTYFITVTIKGIAQRFTIYDKVEVDHYEIVNLNHIYSNVHVQVKQYMLRISSFRLKIMHAS